MALVHMFRENGDGTHIACVTYGTQAEKQFTFNDASVQTLEKALKKIERIKYTRMYSVFITLHLLNNSAVSS